MKRFTICIFLLSVILIQSCLTSKDDLVPMEFYGTTDTIPVKAEVLIFDGMGTYQTYQINEATEFNGSIMVLDDDYEFVEPYISMRIKTFNDSIAELYRDTLTVYLSISINGRLLGECYFDQNSEDSLMHIEQQNGGVDANDWYWYDFTVEYTKPSN